MTGNILLFAALLLIAILLDRMVQPRPVAGGRSLIGTAISLLAVTTSFGLVLALCGNVLASAGFSAAFVALLVLISGAKRDVMGEPLLFSDFAMIGSVFRHPQFYLAALTRVQVVLIVLGLVGVLPLFAAVFVAEPYPHLAGLMIFVAALSLLRLMIRRALDQGVASQPDPEADVLRHGLIATLILYRRRWLATADAVPAGTQPQVPDVEPMLVMIVQCESFACPVELFGDPGLSLPGLASARAAAWQHGRLLVSGFGANTMRTEYGVIFGREEAELGFRCFDPYQTALRDVDHALPARLRRAGWRNHFVHPHDMRFYNRHRIMPAAGFDELVGIEHFAKPGPGEGRYVTDAAMTDRLLALAGTVNGPSLIYAVTIENHGPWAATQASASPSPAYLPLVRNSDAMLASLVKGMGGLGRPSMLVFFGDHRPSIPGLSQPGGDRHTPYVVLRFDAQGRPVSGDAAPRDLTPAQLHHSLFGLLARQAATAVAA
jgi:hypothetical protein